jgi:tRNA (guanine37-N1)-methyltransferase
MSCLQFDVLTIFPELFVSPLKEGIIRRALSAQQIKVDLHNIRDYALDRHRVVDDRPFGGGEGMVMKPEPLTDCLSAVQSKGIQGRVILLSPRGKVFSQQTAARLAGFERLILVCGRYEGVDERFTQLSIDEEISIGDYILTGGELAAMVIIDSVTRLRDGVLGCPESAANDSFSHGMLKHPQYTRPREFCGLNVPEQLLDGNHAEIEKYRFIKSVQVTLKRRPELLKKVVFNGEQLKFLAQAGIAEQVKKITNRKIQDETSS